MKKEDMAYLLADEFNKRGYEWTFGGGTKRVPTYTDFIIALTEAEESMAENTSAFKGRLVISKSAGHTDVYLHIGEI